MRTQKEQDRIIGHLLEQRNSDQTITAYCKSHHLDRKSFHLWRKQYASVLSLAQELPPLNIHPLIIESPPRLEDHLNSVGTISQSRIEFSNGVTLDCSAIGVAELLILINGFAPCSR